MHPGAHKKQKKYAKKHANKESRRRPQHHRQRRPPPLKRYAGDVLAPVSDWDSNGWCAFWFIFYLSIPDNNNNRCQGTWLFIHIYISQKCKKNLYVFIAISLNYKNQVSNVVKSIFTNSKSLINIKVSYVPKGFSYPLLYCLPPLLLQLPDIQCNFPICIAWSNNIGLPSCGVTTQRRGQTQCVLNGNQGLPKCFWQIVRQLKRRKQYYTQMVHSAGGSCKLQLST